MRAYDHLAAAYRDLHHLREITEHLHWDQATYLPAGGHGQRAAHIAVETLITTKLGGEIK